MTKTSIRGFWAGLAVVAGLLAPGVSREGHAQERPVAALGGGYAVISEGELTMPGFFIEGEARLSPRLGIVGQVHHATGSGEGYFSTIDWTDLFVGGGVRFTGRSGSRVQPFAHALVGTYRVDSVEIARSRFGTSDRYYSTEIAALVGGGLTVMVSPVVGFRAGGDVQVHPDALPNLRGTLGMVVAIGGPLTAWSEPVRPAPRRAKEPAPMH